MNITRGMATATMTATITPPAMRPFRTVEEGVTAANNVKGREIEAFAPSLAFTPAASEYFKVVEQFVHETV